MEAALSLISQVGFPIAMCLLLFWYMRTDSQEMKSTIAENTAVMKQILEHFRNEDDN